MKQANENPLTCNGHPEDLGKTRKDSDNDDSATNTSSTSSINDVPLNNCPNASSSSSSNLNTSDVTTNPDSTNELVVLPEVSFNIRIQSSGLEVFELPVRIVESVFFSNDSIRLVVFR